MNKSLSGFFLLLFIAAIQMILGNAQLNREFRLKERLKRKKVLMKTREQQGLTTEDAVLEAILDEEDRQIEKTSGKKKVLSRFYLIHIITVIVRCNHLLLCIE